MLCTIIHGSGAVLFGFALYYEIVLPLYIPEDLQRVNRRMASLTKFPGMLKYLTVWDVALQFLYHAYSLANDILGSNEVVAKKQTQMQKIRDAMFASVGFSTGAFVTITFWALYAVDRELVFTKAIDPFYPFWLNHTAHTAPLLYGLIEHFLVPKVWPKRSASVIRNVIFSTTYVTWVVFVANYTGVWAYRILEVVGNGPRAIFLASIGLSMVGFYFIGEKLHQWRWGAVGDSEKEVARLKGQKKVK